MTQTSSEYWKDDGPVRAYLEIVRDAVPLKAQQHDIMLRLLRALERPVRRVLDLGCGDGLLGHIALDAFPAVRCTLADLSATMLDEARARLAEHAGRCDFIACDYSGPGWLENVGTGYDAVLSGYSIHHQPDVRKREVYAEILGLLEPGGIFINVEHVSSATPWVESRHDDYFIDSLHLHAVRRDPAITWQAMNELYRERRDHGANILAPVEVQCNWLRELGYTDVDVYFKVFELAVFGGRKRSS
jgi:SAM-dependent methyltransferase